MKVSVSIVTYQQHDTVRQAVESALMQETSFPYEIVVGDDASSDGTRVELEALRQRHPDRVRLVLAERNHADFGLTNLRSTLDAAHGEYVAFLDGDDYWTAADKLQRQADLLDASPDCTICAHRVLHAVEDGPNISSPSPGPGISRQGVGTLIRKNFCPKISTMIRRTAIDAVPDWYWSSRMASMDWMMNVLAAREGDILFIDEIMATHRLRADSLTNTYGTDRMLTDKLASLERLHPLLAGHEPAIRAAARKLRLRRQLFRLSPRGYLWLKRKASGVTPPA